MATLLSSATADTTGTLTSHTGPCTAFVHGTMDGAVVVLEASPSTNTTDVVPIDYVARSQGDFRDRTGCVTVDAQGTYYLRAVLSEAGSSTSVTVTTTQ